VGKDGNVITKFSSDVEPESAEITGAIEQALK
jgi:glutathione peroxidase-family protein